MRFDKVKHSNKLYISKLLTKMYSIFLKIYETIKKLYEKLKYHYKKVS